MELEHTPILLSWNKVFLPTVCKGSSFSTSLPVFIIFWIFDSSHLINIRWHIIVVLICISLMIHDFELMSLAHYVITQNVIKTFSCTFWPFLFSLWRNVYSSPLSIFWVVLLAFLCYWVLGVLYIFWILMPFQTYVLHFLPIVKLSFCSVDWVLWNTEVLNLYAVRFTYFYFCCLYFWCHPQEIVAKYNEAFPCGFF